MSNIYSALAPFYDSLMVDVDYGAFADYITSLFDCADRKIERILDIGCGSGSLTIELEKRGYRM
ncbi:MAG: class I SAM-dependent methyltransferase, partial [Clostridia bacterium]|nr:class I SAM-dependent methyltransferase [Clostridia bacterium]